MQANFLHQLAMVREPPLHYIRLLTLSCVCLDGMIIIWAHSSSPQAAAYGSDLTVEEQQNEKEFWRVRCMVR